MKRKRIDSSWGGHKHVGWKYPGFGFMRCWADRVYFTQADFGPPEWLDTGWTFWVHVWEIKLCLERRKEVSL